MSAAYPPSFLPVPPPRAERSPTVWLRRLFHRPLRPIHAEPFRQPAAGLYVDAENLPGSVPARRVTPATVTLIRRLAEYHGGFALPEITYADIGHEP